jgi:methylmalonyl-CoA carboxyltransferase large subunit
MTTESMDWARVCQNLEALRQEVGRLNQRVAALEKNADRIGKQDKETNTLPDKDHLVSRSDHLAVSASGSSSPAEPFSEELIAVLGAAVAAFLGKRAPIRQVRLLGSAAWSQQGRVTIQASHTR